MSNSKNILYLFLLMLLMLTGCETESSLAPLPDKGEEPVEVRFHAIGVEADVTVSRTGYDGVATSLMDDKIGIWNEFYNNLSLAYESSTTDNEKTIYTFDTTDESKVYYPYQTETLPIYAYAPHSNESFHAETQSVGVKSEWVEEPAYDDYIIDPLWAVDFITRATPTAELAFTHQMSRLKIQLITETDVVYSGYTLTLTFDRTQHGRMNLENGEITPTESGEYSYTETWSEETGTVMPINIDHTIMPESILKKIEIQFSVENQNEEYSYTEDNLNKKFEGGKYIPMYIRLGKLTN